MSDTNLNEVALREKSAFADSIYKMIETGELSDFTITLKITTPSGKSENKTYNVHKSIVSAHSGYFKTLFNGSRFKESVTGTVELEEYDIPIFSKVIEFMYHGNYEADDNLLTDAQVFMAADYFDIPKLKSVCVQRIAWKIDLKFQVVGKVRLSPKLEPDTADKLLTALGMICSTGKLVGDTEAMRALSLNLARRAYELRQRPHFEDTLLEHPGIGMLLFKGCLELSTGKGYTTGEKVPVEIFCPRCEVLTKSRWQCPGYMHPCSSYLSTGRTPTGGEFTFGQSPKHLGTCDACKSAFKVTCDICRSSRY